MAAADWANLLPDLVGNIAKRLESLTDHVRLRAVCRSWHFAVPDPPELPILASWTVDSRLTSNFNAFRFTGAKLVPFEHELLSNVLLRNKSCCGYSHGWLALIDLKKPAFSFTLFNPFTNSRFDLPPYSPPDRKRAALTHYVIMGVEIVLSADPTVDPNFSVILLGVHFAIWSRNRSQGSWTHLDLPHQLTCCCHDALFRKGHIVFTTDIEVFAYSIDRNHLSGPVTIPATTRNKQRFLVESAADLLVVGMPLVPGSSFDVFKLVLGGELRVVKVDSLGDRALFLGRNLAISLPATEYCGCRANCVYFAKHWNLAPVMVQVCPEDGRIEDIYEPNPQYSFEYLIGEINLPMVISLWLKPSPILPGPNNHRI